ncbi:MAG: DUF302 domain-containing protein [Actinomycetota bacterium]|nr:DUF302 domain-containing protein [Actinomycetota bacterium]
MADYIFSTTTTGPIDDARERVIAALATESFGVLTEIDVATVMKTKLGKEIDPYLILGACNPALSFRAITAEESIGALLPCNVVLREDAGRVVVDFMDPQAVLDLVDSDDVRVIATEVRESLERVRALIGA